MRVKSRAVRRHAGGHQTQLIEREPLGDSAAAAFQTHNLHALLRIKRGLHRTRRPELEIAGDDESRRSFQIHRRRHCGAI